MFRRITYILSAFLLLTCLPHSGKAQGIDTLSLENIGVEDGLSNNAVTCLMQDHYGLIWMGTYDGLNRFDGADFDIFRNNLSDTFSIINNHVSVIKEGMPDNIWVGTQMGFVRFDYKDFRFHAAYYLPLGEQRPLKVRARIKDILADTLGNVLVATENYGLLFKSAAENVFRQILLKAKTGLNVTAICNFHDGAYLIYLKDQGLYSFEARNGGLHKIAGRIPAATRLLYEPGRRQLLIGTEEGLYSYDFGTGSVTPFSSELAHCNITNLLRDKQGTLWVSTDGNGVAFLKGTLGESTDIRFIKAGREKNQLKSAAVYSVYEDDNGRKWIATLRGGVSLLHAQNSSFRTVNKDDFNPNSLVSNFILSFCEDQYKNIWIGTDGGGISYWNPRTNRFKNYVHQQGDPGSISGNYIVSIIRDHLNNIWIASFNGGIDRLAPGSERFTHYRCYNAYRNAYAKNFWKLFEDSHHRIWLGSTLGDVLFQYDRKNDQFVVYDTTLINIHTIYEDRQGNIWLGNYDQLIKLDTLHKHHAYIHVGYPVRTILEDKKDRLWIGTEGGGLMLYDARSEKFKPFRMEDGFSSNSILNLLLDDKGRIWCSTYNGLSVFDPDTKMVYNYHAHDGLQSNQFSYNAALALSNGKFLFGGIAGFNEFSPARVTKKVKSVKVLVTSFKVNNIAVEKTGLLPKGASPVDFETITTPFKQANFAIRFAGLDYDAPGSVQYGYFLEGWDKSWTSIGNTHNVTYSRLNEGDYILHLAVLQPDGRPLLSTERTITIHVLPPWYRSWWAYLIYLTAIGGLIYAYQKYRQRRTRLLYEMKLTRMNANAERELNERKITFFTNISHEFRTMLTLIINPIKELMDHADETSQPDTIRMAYKNSRRMLGLIGQLLLFRKADRAESQLHISKLNLGTLCREVFDSFAYQAKSQNIDYRFEMAPPPVPALEDDHTKVVDATENGDNHISGLWVYGDLEKMEILLFNLISNAFKYTGNDGRILLRLEEKEAHVLIQLIDSGKGIPEQEKEKVFQKFYQRHETSERAKAGFGIGLFLVKEFVTLHHGTIELESEIGKGTAFTIRIPKGKEHFAGEEISEISDPDAGLAEEIIDSAGVRENEPISTEPGSNRARTTKGGLAGAVMQISNGGEDVSGGLFTDKRTVLIADDNYEIRTFVKRLLADYQVIEAENGRLALDLIEDMLPDLVILDLAMPGYSGDEICSKIKADEKLSHIPVIILTAEASAEIKLRCVEAGADDYITKPFEKELLLARVSNLLKAKSSLQKFFYNEITLQDHQHKLTEEDKSFLNACISVIEEHLDDDQFKVQILVDKMCMSHSSLYKKINGTTGYSVAGFVRFVRLRKAAELFVNTQNNVNEVAFIVGFNDVKYFRAQFQRLFNMTPSAYIKKFRKSFAGTYNRRQGNDIK
ncbi:hybrid sensor histidine kinase/response regulator transcription factor [Arachidicoccus terrestris]|uniref:hybrid sensor histidine kinase/response regulator transcription factor n=1 Tax=Arachidicoccus terrestris TaxID=2875539 RepID=UPI001CC66585|nr:two-component regulator propeller domain-containing protein [Arachidicoccus terrestris]UAY54042.1 response regulator [Arachidicoccus terrestris]